MYAILNDECARLMNAKKSYLYEQII